eukprot:scaffold7381_cov132-Isochrysis_galbana.AAC.2
MGWFHPPHPPLLESAKYREKNSPFLHCSPAVNFFKLMLLFWHNAQLLSALTPLHGIRTERPKGTPAPRSTLLASASSCSTAAAACARSTSSAAPSRAARRQTSSSRSWLPLSRGAASAPSRCSSIPTKKAAARRSSRAAAPSVSAPPGASSRWGWSAPVARARISTAHGCRARRSVDATVASAERHDARTAASSSRAPRISAPTAASACGGSASPSLATAWHKTCAPLSRRSTPPKPEACGKTSSASRGIIVRGSTSAAAASMFKAAWYTNESGWSSRSRATWQSNSSLAIAEGQRCSTALRNASSPEAMSGGSGEPASAGKREDARGQLSRLRGHRGARVARVGLQRAEQPRAQQRLEWRVGARGVDEGGADAQAELELLRVVSLRVVGSLRAPALQERRKHQQQGGRARSGRRLGGGDLRGEVVRPNVVEKLRLSGGQQGRDGRGQRGGWARAARWVNTRAMAVGGDREAAEWRGLTMQVCSHSRSCGAGAPAAAPVARIAWRKRQTTSDAATQRRDGGRNSARTRRSRSMLAPVWAGGLAESRGASSSSASSAAAGSVAPRSSRDSASRPAMRSLWAAGASSAVSAPLARSASQSRGGGGAAQRSACSRCIASAGRPRSGAREEWGQHRGKQPPPCRFRMAAGDGRAQLRSRATQVVGHRAGLATLLCCRSMQEQLGGLCAHATKVVVSPRAARERAEEPHR